MSRKGKMPIALPKGVEVKMNENQVTVKGPKGTLSHDIDTSIHVNVDGQTVVVSPVDGAEDVGNLYGLYRAIINNMVVGVSQGFNKQLEMVGVGYRAAVQGNLLDLQIGQSHPIKLPIPQGLTIKVEKTIITITGADKQQVGQYAATVRSERPPEPYQGKGIRYVGEKVRRKQGKTSGKK